MIGSHRYVQHPNRVVTANGMTWAGVMPDDQGQMSLSTVYGDRDTAIRVWRNMQRSPQRVCELLGIDFADAQVVDVGRVTEEVRQGGTGWRIVGVAGGCHDVRVLDRRPGPDWDAVPDVRDRVAALIGRVLTDAEVPA